MDISDKPRPLINYTMNISIMNSFAFCKSAHLEMLIWKCSVKAATTIVYLHCEQAYNGGLAKAGPLVSSYALCEAYYATELPLMLFPILFIKCCLSFLEGQTLPLARQEVQELLYFSGGLSRTLEIRSVVLFV